MSLRPRDRLVLGVVAVVAVLGAFYMLALKPERQKASALQAQIVTQQQALAAAQQSYTVGRAAQASLKKDGAEWAALKVAVPEQSDIPALLRTLEKSAKSVHVSMQALSLSGSGTGAAATPAPAASTPASATGAAGAATTPAATPVPIQLTFGGGYVALNKLVRKLTGLATISGGKVHATGPLLSINSVALTGTKSLTGQLTATIYQLAAPAGTTTGGQG
jgi:Type II secretion system (T2SS), protein M